jgi:hypothetical protein
MISFLQLPATTGVSRPDESPRKYPKAGVPIAAVALVDPLCSNRAATQANILKYQEKR